MDNKMEKRYGLPTAIAMVVGIVIGSGIFIKGGKVLAATNGNLLWGVAVVGVVGLICIICSLVFATLGSKYEKVNGVVDYAEMALGPNYAYYVGWFMNTIYMPALVAILGFFSSMMFLQLFGVQSLDFENGTIEPIAIGVGAGFVMIGYGLNILSPKLAGKMQVSMTVIKLIPLVVMGIVGTIVGFVRIADGDTVSITMHVLNQGGEVDAGKFFSAIVAFAFAYEGWILATSINSELKDAKKNLPRALIIGSLITVVIYALYIWSMNIVGNVGEVMVRDSGILGTWPLGETLPKVAFTKLFGATVGLLVYVFVTISCLGTMNGLIMSSCRGLYALSARGMGPKPEFFGDVDKQNNFCIKSGIVGMMLGGFWYAWTVMLWMGGPDFMGTLYNGESFALANYIAWEPDEIGIICLYIMYIPMMIGLMIKAKDLNVFQRFVLPVLGVASCLFFAYALYAGKGWQQCVGFLVFFAIVEFVGYLFKGKAKA